MYETWIYKRRTVFQSETVGYIDIRDGWQKQTQNQITRPYFSRSFLAWQPSVLCSAAGTLLSSQINRITSLLYYRIWQCNYLDLVIGSAKCMSGIYFFFPHRWLFFRSRKFKNHVGKICFFLKRARGLVFIIFINFTLDHSRKNGMFYMGETVNYFFPYTSVITTTSYYINKIFCCIHYASLPFFKKIKEWF